MPGVKAVDANPISQTTTVTFDDSKVTLKDILREFRVQQISTVGEPKYIK
jgi:copper chaperone CopZ